jgi:hypothetical protein
MPPGELVELAEAVSDRWITSELGGHSTGSSLPLCGLPGTF